jgi:hypothetical protein
MFYSVWLMCESFSKHRDTEQTEKAGKHPAILSHSVLSVSLWFILFAGSVTASWLAGIAGSWFVWNFIYGIGSRVISDDIHFQLHDAVVRGGGIAGVSVALAAQLLLRRPAPEVLGIVHAMAVIAGVAGGSTGWQQGLWAYFGAFVAFVVCLAFRVLFRSL